MHAPSPRPTETPEGRRITRYDDAGRHVGTGDAGTPSILPPQGTVDGDPGGAAPRKWTRHCALVALACSEALARPPQGALGTASEVLAQRSPAHQRAWLAPESPRCSRLLSPVPKPPGGDIEAAARTMTKHSPAAPRKSCSLCKSVRRGRGRTDPKTNGCPKSRAATSKRSTPSAAPHDPRSSPAHHPCAVTTPGRPGQATRSSTRQGEHRPPHLPSCPRSHRGTWPLPHLREDAARCRGPLSAQRRPPASAQGRLPRGGHEIESQTRHR